MEPFELVPIVDVIFYCIYVYLFLFGVNLEVICCSDYVIFLSYWIKDFIKLDYL